MNNGCYETKSMKLLEANVRENLGDLDIVIPFFNTSKTQPKMKQLMSRLHKINICHSTKDSVERIRKATICEKIFAKDIR